MSEIRLGHRVPLPPDRGGAGGERELGVVQVGLGLGQPGLHLEVEHAGGLELVLARLQRVLGVAELGACGLQGLGGLDQPTARVLEVVVGLVDLVLDLVLAVFEVVGLGIRDYCRHTYCQGDDEERRSPARVHGAGEETHRLPSQCSGK